MASEPRNRWVPCTFLPWEYPFGPHFFKRLLDNLYDGIYFVDVERRILYWNKGAERISGFRSDEVVGRFCYGHLYDFHESHSCDECRENCPIVRAIDSGESINDRVYLRHKDGRRIAVDTHVMPIRSENGEIQGGVEVFRDASATVALEMAYGRLRDLAEKDPLTSLANRRNIDSFLHEQLDVLSRTGLCFSVIMADLDHFKQVNDTWGHEVGGRPSSPSPIASAASVDPPTSWEGSTARNSSSSSPAPRCRRPSRWPSACGSSHPRPLPPVSTTTTSPRASVWPRRCAMTPQPRSCAASTPPSTAPRITAGTGSRPSSISSAARPPRPPGRSRPAPPCSAFVSGPPELPFAIACDFCYDPATPEDVFWVVPTAPRTARCSESWSLVA